MHRVHEKINGEPHSRVTHSDQMIAVSPEVEQIIKTRLIDAAGRDSRSFELSIENKDEGSFFSLGKNIIESNGDSFIGDSKEIADLLGNSQTHHLIPGGYIIIINALLDEESPLIIVIKAEPHEALKIMPNDQISIEKVFLSPSQKLYKIGVLHLIKGETSLDSKSFTSYLFDDQFRQDGQPAEYFYKTFLGLSVSENSKIQTLQFYLKTESFILSNLIESEDKIIQFTHLKSFIASNIETIRPLDFANSYMIESFRDKYISNVVRELPNSFIKDPILIKNKLKQRKISFGGSVKITGPENSFNDNVKIYHNIDELEDIDTNSEEYSILIIKGLPFENE